jgi:DNA-binding NarL/FixJ family response regulator
MKILIADDHALFREGLRHVLGQLEGVTEVLEAGTCGEALELAAADPALGLVLLDIRMPDMSGLDGLATLVERHPLLPVVVLSASLAPEDMQQALDGGATGFIPKTATGPVMLSALRLVLSGGVYVPPEMLAPPPRPEASGEPPLTPRQIEVLRLLERGDPNKVIARELALSEATVKAHIGAIMRALGVRNRTQAVRAARELGLLTGDDQA